MLSCLAHEPKQVRKQLEQVRGPRRKRSTGTADVEVAGKIALGSDRRSRGRNSRKNYSRRKRRGQWMLREGRVKLKMTTRQQMAGLAVLGGELGNQKKAARVTNGGIPRLGWEAGKNLTVTEGSDEGVGVKAAGKNGVDENDGGGRS